MHVILFLIGTAPPWNDLLVAERFGPVCPQNLPNLNNTTTGISRGRYEQLKRLLIFLESEKEDCLYLNLYIPNNGKF